MFNKKAFIKHERVKSSIIRKNKPVNLFNDKVLLSNPTDLSTTNTCAFSKFSTINKNKVYKISQKNSPFNSKTEKQKIKRLLKKPIIPKNESIIKNRANLDPKKYIRGKICNLMQKNIILIENQFHPRKFTESISNVHVKGFKNRFKNFDNREKVGIFTNKYPNLLSDGDKFYSRYFDYFMSPDEMLANNFTKKEIFQIKTEPSYYNIGGSFNGIYFFRKKKLRDILNEEEKVGINNIMEVDMKKSLRKSRRKIKSYLNYYTSVMSRRGFVHN